MRECSVGQRLYRRYTPAINGPCGNRLLGIICDFGAKAVNHPVEVMIRALDKIPRQHERFDAGIDSCQTSMEKTAAEIAEELVLLIFPSTYGAMR